MAVAFVLNAQFTWWVMHSLHENRDRLDLERQLLAAHAETGAITLELRLRRAVQRLLELPPGVIPSAEPPFQEIQVVDEGGAGESSPAPTGVPGWTTVGDEAAFRVPLRRGRSVIAILDSAAPRRWLADIDPTLRLERPDVADPDLPAVRLSAPLDGMVVVPDAADWSTVLASHRRRIVLVVVQGIVLMLAMASAVALVWAAVRREGRRERQHQNFVSAITHELKTPIAGIRLALETVLSGRVDDEARTRFLNNALIDAERLSDLVQKVLEITRYGGGAGRLSVELSDLSELVEYELGAARRRAGPRGVSLEGSIEEGIQAPFDPEALAIVCSNLLENALKYAAGGDPPTVRVGLRLDAGNAVLEVSDNGIGIKPEELESIFQPFYRSGDEVTRRTPGTGIGLYVAREIVAAHGGRLTASSEGVGKGAAFKLVLPGASLFSEDDFSE